MNTLAERLKALIDWWPLVLLMQQVTLAKPGRARAAALATTLRYLASKTENEADDILIEHVQRVIATPEGGELIDYVVTLVARPGGV